MTDIDETRMLLDAIDSLRLERDKLIGIVRKCAQVLAALEPAAYSLCAIVEDAESVRIDMADYLPSADDVQGILGEERLK